MGKDYITWYQSEGWTLTRASLKLHWPREISPLYPTHRLPRAAWYGQLHPPPALFWGLTFGAGIRHQPGLWVHFGENSFGWITAANMSLGGLQGSVGPPQTEAGLIMIHDCCGNSCI